MNYIRRKIAFIILITLYLNVFSQKKTTTDFYLDSTITYTFTRIFSYNGETAELQFKSSEELFFMNGFLTEHYQITTNPAFNNATLFNYNKSTLLSETQKTTSEFGYTEDIINYEYDSINSTVIIKKGYGDSPKKITQKLYYENCIKPNFIETFDDFEDYIILKEILSKDYSKKIYYNALGEVTGTIIQLFNGYLPIKTISISKIGRKRIFDHEIYKYDTYGNLEQIDFFTVKNKQLYRKKTPVQTITKFSNFLVNSYWVIQIDQKLNAENNGFYVTVRVLKDDKNNIYKLVDDGIILDFCKKIYNELKLN